MAEVQLDSELLRRISLSELDEVDVKSFTGHEDDVSISCYAPPPKVLHRQVSPTLKRKICLACSA